MAEAKSGDTVKVHYTGRLDDGRVFDSSRDRDPLEFQLGTGQIIPGFEQAVEGMEPGDTKTVTLPPDDAYGPRRDELVRSLERDRFPDHLDPEVGQQLEMRQGEEVFLVTVTDVSDAEVEIDANHPLAGQELTFDLELVAVG